MLQGTFINYDQSSKATDGLDYSKYPYPKVPSEMGNNRTEMNLAKYRIRELVPKEPIKYLKWFTIGKARKQIDSPYYEYSKGNFLGVSNLAARRVHNIILMLCFFGIVVYYINKTRNKMGTLIFATIIYFIVDYLPFMGMSRYFYPSMPYVIIFAAYGLIYLIEKVALLGENISMEKNTTGS